MRVAVFGLGYVGSVSAACLAQQGNEVIGIDTNDYKVELLRAGRSPIVEPGIGTLISETVKSGSLRATTAVSEAVEWADVCVVCVGTPGRPDGEPDLTFLLRVTDQIGRAAINRTRVLHVMYRSTVLPGTLDEVLIPALEVSCLAPVGPKIVVTFVPEFLREGCAIRDFNSPALTVVGGRAAADADLPMKLLSSGQSREVVTSIRNAEMFKYACNSFHALKVTFANEVAAVSRAHGVDGKEVMQMLCLDRQLNISDAYLLPGTPFGGSCLPKDLRALIRRAKVKNIQVPLLDGIRESNEAQKRRIIESVVKTEKRQIGFIGVSFKETTDDLRESPSVELLEYFIGKGYVVKAYDPSLRLGNLVGANKQYIDRELPHIEAILESSLEAIVTTSDVLVVMHKDAPRSEMSRLLRRDQTVIDLWDSHDAVALASV